MIATLNDQPDFAHRDPHAIPHELRDEVEMWARENRGTHGSVVWNPILGCAEVRLELRDSDPRMAAWRGGSLKNKPCETVFLHRQEEEGVHWKGIPLDELGVEFVRKWLDAGNMWSGRGRHKSLDSACKAADQHNTDLDNWMAEEAVENARLNARDNKRQVLDLPLVAVPANLE